MAMNSIRLRVLALAIAAVIVVLAVAGTSLVVLFERQVLRYVAQDLNVRWTELAAVFQFDPEGKPALSHTLTDPRYQQPLGGAYWQVSEGQEVVLRSRSLWDNELPQAMERWEGGSDDAFEAEGPDDAELYIVRRAVTLESASGPRVFSLSVALDHKQIAELSHAFGWDVARVLLPIAAVLILFAWLQIWLGLRPLRVVGLELNAVQTGRIRRMSRRVPIEIEPLVDSVNRLLDRQESLVRKARDRAGALAHGLKTPLTVLGGEVRRLEQGGLKPEADRMQEQLSLIRAHVDREVARARTSGASVGCGAYTAVEETVARLVRLMQHMPRGEEIAWEVRISPALGVDMDPHDFGEVLGNLLDNARKWARSKIAIRAEITGGRARIFVEDDGPGFSGQRNGARPERGFAQASDATSSGLGLSIVEDILAEYRAELAIIDGARGCRVSFEIRATRELAQAADEDMLTQGQAPTERGASASSTAPVAPTTPCAHPAQKRPGAAYSR